MPFAHPTRFSTAPQNRHPERSASQIRRIKKDLGRGVEGPRRCLLADALLGFPPTNYVGNQKVTISERSASQDDKGQGGASIGIGRWLRELQIPRLALGMTKERAVLPFVFDAG